MVPSSNQLGGGSSSMNPSLLRANSNLMSGSHPPNPGLPAQSPFSSLVSPRTGFANSNLLGNISNVSALLNRPSMNNGPGTDLPSPSIPDPLSFPSSSTAPQNLSEHQPSTQLGQHQDFSNQMKQELPNGVKLEPGSVKLEQPQAQLQQQQMNQMRIGSNMGGPVKMETDAGTIMLLQQQRLMQQQQRLMQLHQQQQQQQQMTKQHRGPQSGVPQQIPQQNNTVALRGKSGTHYEPGTCARRLTHYMFNQQKRPQDNNIEFWRSFVGEYYAPNAKKRWCVSLYGSGRQPTGVFPQDVWHCEICNRKPGRGFETTVEVLPRLCQIKYASGTIEELLYVDMPKEYPNPSGQIVLDYAKAIQESVFDQLRVVREGQLRIVFNSDLKIASWEFCARRHEELIPRRSIIPQVSQLGDVVRKYQSAAQNSAAPLSTQDLQNTCNSFVGSARQLAKALEVPLVNDLGYTKRYVRCLQIAEVVNCMKDLIDYSRQTGTGPMESLNNFPRRNSSAMNNNSTQLQSQQPEQIQNQNQNPTNHNASNGPNSANHTDPIPIPIPIPVPNTNNTSTTNQSLPPVPTPQNPIKQELQIPAPNRTPNPNPNPVPSTSNSMMPPQQPSRDTDESQSSVQRILQEMMMSSQLNGVNNNSNEIKPRANGGLNGYGTGPVQSGLRGSMSSGAVMMNGPVQMGMGGQNHNPMGGNNLQQEMGGQMMRSVNSFNNLYDWKSNQ